ncbi:alpha/beta hydrolase [Mycobacterium xenopi]|uniref:alpha/beta hydrolase n=1 Tax=Mycobacterium xenopi TaxID=1789 RepID=UPI001E3E5B6C|nr:alpha/beta hydrolase [Mycobacterium xenopi]MDA3642371.1 alpha/beta hydrolase [Mycobacterium xenopi]MDA3660435.1 alpha/beta hydrolase [Mycobacterium xenopi]
MPGLGSSTRTTLDDMVKEARSLREEATQQLRNAGKSGSVSTIAFMGYDPPANPRDTGSPRDIWRTIHDDRAQAGAANLSSYLQHVRANNPTAHLTLLGHSLLTVSPGDDHGGLVRH